MNTIEDVLKGESRYAVVCGDVTEVLKALPDNSIHAAYCDPPYGLSTQDTDDLLACLGAWLKGEVYRHDSKGFMGNEWDAFVPGPEAWREVKRVLKPGAYCVAFSSTRTVDLLGISMRIAGLELREGFCWVFGSGFPKSMNVGKALDKTDKADAKLRFVQWMKTTGLKAPEINAKLEALGLIKKDSSFAGHFFSDTQPAIPTTEHWAVVSELCVKYGVTPPDWIEEIIDLRENGSKVFRDREVVGTQSVLVGHAFGGPTFEGEPSAEKEVPITLPATDAAKEWAGYGTTTKPAFEPLVVTRKAPVGTIANNVLMHGCGVFNIDGSRIDGALEGDPDRFATTTGGTFVKFNTPPVVRSSGRFPAALALIHDEGCQEIGVVRVHGNRTDTRPEGDGGREDKSQWRIRPTDATRRGYSDEDGTETVTEWRCTPTCAVAELARQSGELTSGSITAGRPNGSNAHFSQDRSRIATKDVPGDVGTATRFFYQGKATSADRLTYLTCSEGCPAHDTVAPDHYAQKKCPHCKQPRTTYQHPTVKPYQLAQYHAKLLSLPSSVKPIAIVPFCGTGIEARALMDVGFRVIAIDIDPRHVKMTLYRLGGVQPVRERTTVVSSVIPTSLEDLLGF
jgi:DNA modification methylase